MCVCYDCCVLSGRGLRDEVITRLDESYRLCVCVCLIVCDLESSQGGGLGPSWTVAPQKRKGNFVGMSIANVRPIFSTFR
jgi:hypothetical protein